MEDIKEKSGAEISKSKWKVAPEMAENDFNNWAEAWKIDVDTDKMDVEDRASFNGQKAKIMLAIQEGNARISSDGMSIEYDLIEPIRQTTTLIMNIPKGTAFIAMDKYKEREFMHKNLAFMADATKQPPKIFSEMDGRDMRFFVAVTSLFLG